MCLARDLTAKGLHMGKLVRGVYVFGLNAKYATESCLNCSSTSKIKLGHCVQIDSSMVFRMITLSGSQIHFLIPVYTLFAIGIATILAH